VNFCMGGEFAINEKIWLQENNYELHKFSNGIYTDMGRSALLLALQAIIQQGGKKQAWLPGYCCSAVLAPFYQLDFHIDFYSMGDDLQTPVDLPREFQGVFLVIHYFGKKNTAILDWLETRQGREGVYVIEDCVQGSLTEEIGLVGDFSVRSYRKFLPQPDGAVLTCRQPFVYELLASDEEFISKKIVAKILRGQKTKEENFLTLFAESEERMSGHIVPRHMSWMSEYLLQKSDIDGIKQQRRENWFALNKLLDECGLFEQLFKKIYLTLESSEIPLGYPVIVREDLRDALREYLSSYQIFCPVHWPIEHAIGKGQLFVERKLSATMLTLPIDQQVRLEMLEYMVDKILAFRK
jgi:dTDP-4-amino-4,6-dideoxygalactose transaminase